MKKAGLLTTGFLATAMIFAANNDASAQDSNDVSVAKTEVDINNIPVIAEGTSGQAADISALTPSIVLYISGGQDPKYSAEDYAKMFRVMFKDQNRTDFPSDIYVRYEESGQARQTAVSANINRRSFDKNGGTYENGDGVFTPAEILKYIPQITEQNTIVNELALRPSEYPSHSSRVHGNASSFNDMAKTESSINNAPIIKIGHGGEAQTLSVKNSALVIYLSGGNAETKYTAQQYAKMLQIMFKDENRTPIPLNVSVVYQESGKDRPTHGAVFINGREYDKNGEEHKDGDGVLTPEQMLELIPEITFMYASENNISLALNEPLKQNMKDFSAGIKDMKQDIDKLKKINNLLKNWNVNQADIILSQVGYDLEVMSEANKRDAVINLGKEIAAKTKKDLNDLKEDQESINNDIQSSKIIHRP